MTLDQDSRETLIRVETTVNMLCTKVDNLSAKFDKREELCGECEKDIYEKIGEVDNKKVDFSVFKWISGGFCVSVVIIIGYLIICGTQVNTNKTNINHVLKSYSQYYQVPDDK